MALRCDRIRSKASFAPGNRVVHELASEQLAAVVVNSMLVDSLSKTLSDSSVNLAGDQKRIDHVAAIVDRDIAQDEISPVSLSISVTAMCAPKG